MKKVDRFILLKENGPITLKKLAEYSDVSVVTIRMWARNSPNVVYCNSEGNILTDTRGQKVYLKIVNLEGGCKICSYPLINNKSLTSHLKVHHIKIKDYYDSFIKKENEGICKNCGKNTNFKNISDGYYRFCSVKCVALNKDTLEKKKHTCLERYKVEHPRQSNIIKNKIKATCLKKYGTNYPIENDLIKNKIKKTFLNKYGGHISKNKDVKDKKKETCLKKYGVTCSLHNEEIKEKIKKTFLNKYKGSPNRDKKINEKRLNTFYKNRLPNVYKLLKSLNLELLSDYYKTKDIINIKCLLCNNIFQTNFFALQQGYGKCLKCYPKYKSIAETNILNFINLLKLKTISNSKKIIPPLELDIYIPEKKLAIEYNGLYWHSEKIKEDKNYHLNKLNLCINKEIRLIQIFEDEWLFKQDIIKARLRQILNINDSIKIHARSCNIKEIAPNIKNEFLEEYHLQGRDISNIKLGAFYNEKLVSVMTFSKGNIAKGSHSKDNIWELNRFCTNYTYHIPGIASKLLTYFKRNYQWEQIYSYADRRWSTGNLYYKLGFELEKETQPNYWYVKGLKRIHRFSLRKRPDEPKDIPEWFLRVKEGYFRVWDCGHLKFVMQNLKRKE